jgi:site-specific DNA-methyltransferase (adenine-specific)
MIERNKVYHGDCLEVMKEIPDKSIDMILCDLPYGTTACKWYTIIPFDPLWAQYKRIIKDNGVVVLCGQEPFSSYLRMSNIKHYKYDWIWKKNISTLFQHCNKIPLSNHELISVFYNKQCIYNPQNLLVYDKINKRGSMGNNLGKGTDNNYIQKYTNYPRRILEFAKDGNHHSTQKPVALFEYLIKTYTNEGDLVLDNCAGSGTTAIACLNTKRDYILIEKEKEYIDIINKRIKEHKQL